MYWRKHWHWVLLLGIYAVGEVGVGREIVFNRDVRPILSDHCWACHGPDAAERKADLRLDLHSGIVKEVAIPGESHNSLLIEKIFSNDPEEIMPPPESKKPLTQDQKLMLKEWIDHGLDWQDHWAWIAPDKGITAQPNSIDSLLKTSLEDHGLPSSKPADPRTLIRRLSLDMLGLPPDPALVESFATNPSDEHFRKIVESYLQSPAFGERLAVLWLDLVRYADTNGYHADLEWSVWPYRDYVIQAFNANMPFDRFTREQLAGDLLENPTTQQKVAAGYNRLNMKSTEFGIQDKEYLAKYAADRVRTTSTTWMGSTLGCAECHDHKYDPFSTRDFYSFAAYFADIKGLGYFPNAQNIGWGETMKVIDPDTESKLNSLQNKLAHITQSTLLPSGKDNQTVWKFTTDQPSEDWFTPAFKDDQWKEGKAGFGSKGTPHSKIGTEWTSPDIWLRKSFSVPDIPEKLILTIQHDEDASVFINGKKAAEFKGFSTESADYSKIGIPPDLLTPGNNIIAVHCHQTTGGQFIDIGLTSNPNSSEKLQNQIAELEKSIPTMLATISTTPRMTRILPRGNWMDKSGDVVTPATPHFLGNQAEGNRLDLADWLTHPDNPLTARVFVNRLWKVYFGSGLSKVLDDIGTRGEWPNHPELLDWLALEFINSSWDIKHVVRLIVESDAYRQTSQPDASHQFTDPENRLFARQSRFRLEAEFIRDNALKASGLLNTRIGGPSVKPYQPDGYWDNLYFPRRTYHHDKDDNQYRRGVYIHWQRQFLHPALLAFDAPSREECTAERPQSNTPLGALVLLNDPTYIEAARVMAANVLQSDNSDIQNMAELFRLVLARTPSKAESEVLLSLIDKHHAQYREDTDAAEKLLNTGLYPLPPNQDKARLAAWTSAARTILNLHESITRY